MAENKRPDVKIIKVHAYPIACQLTLAPGQPPIAAFIQRLEEHGFLFQASGHFFKIGEEYTCEFEIPVFRDKITQPIKIFKTTESTGNYVPGAPKEIHMTVEVHFKNKTGTFQVIIRKFLEKIKQHRQTE